MNNCYINLAFIFFLDYFFTNCFWWEKAMAKIDYFYGKNGHCSPRPPSWGPVFNVNSCDIDLTAYVVPLFLQL